VGRELLFYRPCKRCEVPFLYNGSREPGRRYCGGCAAPARKERQRKARATYRKSDEGIEQHRAEEAARRAELQKQKSERVGDRRCPEDEASVEGASAEGGEPAAEEPDDAPVRDDGEWVLVAWPGLLAAAIRLQGKRVACSICARVGVVVEVVELAVWRRSGSRIRAFG
jgi:hypothetical protein